MEESGEIKGKGQKTVHTFIYEGTGEEIYITSNVIESGFRRGMTENCEGRYIEIEEALRLIHKNQQTLLNLYAERYL